MYPFAWMQEAQNRITAYIHKTPLTYDEGLDVYLKWENHQVTGSFKVRGAVNKVLSMKPWERDQGIVTASAGNHGQGLAYAAKLVGAPVTVFVSQGAVPKKLRAMRDYGAIIHLVPGGYGEAEKAGLAYAQEHSGTWVSAYNDGQIIAGQGTIGLEVLSQVNIQGVLAWIVPTGGGGLLTGIGASLKAQAQPNCIHRLIGVQSVASPFMYRIFYTGTQENIIEYPSLADGLAGPVQENSITIPLVRQYVDEMLVVEEEEIEQAIRFAWQKYRERIEGSAAVTLAAILTGRISERPAVLIISGGNIQPEIHERILEASH